MENDNIVSDFKGVESIIKVPLICVYHEPPDYPEYKYVARLFDLDKPTNIIAVAESLEKIREIKPYYMVIFHRSDMDDACIVESWL